MSRRWPWLRSCPGGIVHGAHQPIKAAFLPLLPIEHDADGKLPLAAVLGMADAIAQGDVFAKGLACHPIASRVFITCVVTQRGDGLGRLVAEKVLVAVLRFIAFAVDLLERHA